MSKMVVGLNSRISKDDEHRAAGGLQPVAVAIRPSWFRKENEHQCADRQTTDAHRDPEGRPGQSPANDRSHGELTCGAAGHPEHLRRADQRRSARRWEIRRRDVDRPHEREYTAGALQKSPDAGGLAAARREE
jgi:hypothetical protein